MVEFILAKYQRRCLDLIESGLREAKRVDLAEDVHTLVQVFVAATESIGSILITAAVRHAKWVKPGEEVSVNSDQMVETKAAW